MAGETGFVGSKNPETPGHSFDVTGGFGPTNWTPSWRAVMLAFSGATASRAVTEHTSATLHDISTRMTVVLHGRPWDTRVVNNSEGKLS